MRLTKHECLWIERRESNKQTPEATTNVRKLYTAVLVAWVVLHPVHFGGGRWAVTTLVDSKKRQRVLTIEDHGQKMGSREHAVYNGVSEAVEPGVRRLALAPCVSWPWRLVAERVQSLD